MAIATKYFSLEVDMATERLACTDAAYFSYKTSGSVVMLDDPSRPQRVGRFSLYYIDVDAALNAGTSVSDVFRARNATAEYFAEIFQPAPLRLSNQLADLSGDPDSWGNVMIIDKVEILPSYRSSGLGLVVARRLIERYSAGATVVVLRPMPSQCRISTPMEREWLDQLAPDKFPADPQSGMQKLRRVMSRLGFKSAGRSESMYRLADSMLPTPAELLKNPMQQH